MKPLTDITIIDLTINTPGPYCTMILSDLGARVIKIEPPGGDPLRNEPSMFETLNRGKESIEVDLKTEFGRSTIKELVRNADVVLEGSRPGVAERLSVDYQSLSSENPALVYCSISGFGQSGPWKNRPAHDINFLALSGYLGLQEQLEGRPWPPVSLISDLASGLYASTLILSHLCVKEPSRKGTYIDLSMAEAVLSFIMPEIAKAHTETTSTFPNVSGTPHYGVFLCSDQKWISLGIVSEDHFWIRLCKSLGLVKVSTLKHHERIAKAPEIRSLLEQAFMSRPAHEWDEILTDADVPCAPVVSLEEALRFQQFEARHAICDLNGIKHVVLPAKLSSANLSPDQAAPKLNEHKEHILKELSSTQFNKDIP